MVYKADPIEFTKEKAIYGLVAYVLVIVLLVAVYV